MQRLFFLSEKAQFEADLEILGSALPSSFAERQHDARLTRCVAYCFDRKDRLALQQLFFTLFNQIGDVRSYPQLVFFLYLLYDESSDWFVLLRTFSAENLNKILTIFVKLRTVSAIEASLSQLLREITSTHSLERCAKLQTVIAENLTPNSKFHTLLNNLSQLQGPHRHEVMEELSAIFNLEAKKLYANPAAETVQAGEEEYLYKGGYFYLQYFIQGKIPGYKDYDLGFHFVLRPNTEEERSKTERWKAVLDTVDVPCMTTIKVPGATLEKIDVDNHPVFILRPSQHQKLKIVSEFQFLKLSLFEILDFRKDTFNEFFPVETHKKIRGEVCQSVLKTGTPAEDISAWKNLQPFLLEQINARPRPSAKML